LNNIVEPESGLTILFNIVDSYEQCGQQNIVQSCFHQYCINLSVFMCVGGENIDETTKSIDTFKPTNKDEFNELAKMLADKLSQFEVCDSLDRAANYCRTSDNVRLNLANVRAKVILIGHWSDHKKNCHIHFLL
jgi:hypothetical protein